MSTEKPRTKQPMFSPLKRWRKEHCSQCGDRCNPSDKRLIVCVICDLTDTVRRNAELAREGVHTDER